MEKRNDVYQIVACAGILFSTQSFAANIGDTDFVKFESGKKAVAADVNGNFDKVKAAVNAKQERVSGACAAGSSIRVINVDGSVECEIDKVGSGSTSGLVSVVGAGGSGITVSTTGSTATIGTDTTVLQKRIATSCGNGQVMRGVNADGTPICIADANSGDITGVTAGTGLAGGGATGDVTLSIATAGVTSAHIADGTVSTADLANSSVTAAKIAVDSVGSSAVQQNAINKSHLSDEPGATTSGAGCSYPIKIGGCNTTITTAAVNVRSVTIIAPAAGYVVLFFSGSASLSHTNGTRDYLSIEINESSTANVCSSGGGLILLSTCNNSYRYVDADANMPSGGYAHAISTQTQFAVASAGTYTYYLDAQSSKDTGISIGEHAFTAMYFPTSY